jgi:hypothetical protein
MATKGKGLNWNWIMWSGLAAGFVMNVLDFVVHGVLLKDQWTNAMTALGRGGGDMSMMGWIALDFITGWVLMFLYAAMRPRFGGNPKTAIVASMVLWFVSHTMFASNYFMGIFPLSLVIAAAIGSLPSMVGAGLVGGWMYKET